MSDIVKLQIKITGSDSFKEVEVSAKELAEAIDAVKKRSHELNEKLLNANQIAQTIDQVGSAIQSLHSVMRGLTDAYAVQSAAEARLEQMMRNTMGATDDEIQSIKDLAAEQQKLGVIGDEVILSGAQELATYMQKKESLEALIPVMDDMIAQQYGYNASAESAVSVAQMLGKVFAGETGALKRLGYTFDEAQEAVLKYGTEEEKVAMLTEVVGQIVDGTNAKLAATPYGQIVNARNAFGDLKETLGEMVAPAMNAVEGLANVTIALSGIAKGVVYVKQATAALTAFAQSSRMASTRMAVLRVHSIMTATAQRMLGAAGISAAAGTTALKVAVTGLYAAMTLGLSAAITAIVALITRLANSGREAADGMDTLTEANEAYKSAASNAKAEIDTEIAALKNLMDQGKDTTDAIQKLNEKYGEAFGYHQTAADWYDTLTGKSQTYCRQLGYETKAKSLSASIGAKIVERDELKDSLPAGDWKWDAEAKRYRDFSMNLTVRYADKETHKKLAQIANLDRQIEDDTNSMNAAFGEAAKAADQMKGSVDGATKSVSWQTMSYAQLGDAIKDQKKKVGELADATTDAAKRETATLAAMQKRHHELGVQLGLETEHTKNTGQATEELTGQLTSLKEINARIAELQKQRLDASLDEINAVVKEIEKVERLKELYEEVAKTGKLPKAEPIDIPKKPDFPDTLPQREDTSPYSFTSSKQFSDRLAKLNVDLDLAPKSQRQAIEEEIALVQRLKDEFEGVNQTVAASPLETFAKGWGGIKGIGNSIRSIKDALTETDNAWDALTQTIDGFISLFQSLQAVVEIIKTITSVTKAFQVVEETANATQIAANASLSTSNTAVAATAAAASVAGIPFIGPQMALTWAATIASTLNAIPKFANGGLVYGPTLGLMGEYGGASSNPEVIAPLDKLRSLIGGNGGGGTAEVKFRIEGRELVGIMNKQNNIYTRSK